MDKDTVMRSCARVALLAVAFAGMAGSGCTATKPPRAHDGTSVQAFPGVARLILLNATVVTMDDAQPIAEAVAVDTYGKIIKVGNNIEVIKLATRTTQRVDATGMTILPGFIDPHSHMAGYGMYDDPDHWLDVSAINAYFKPAPGSAACITPTDPQHCFIPVENHGQVMARLRAAAAKAKLNTPPTAVLAFNYDPSRLGHDPSCVGKPGSVSFECTTFEDGNARAQLDSITQDVPIYVTSESGHISYVNSTALSQLNTNVWDGRSSTMSCSRFA